MSNDPAHQLLADAASALDAAANRDPDRVGAVVATVLNQLRTDLLDCLDLAARKLARLAAEVGREVDHD